jgi:hypothetical protein
MKLMELYKEKIMGTISGLDRIRFRGTWRWLANDRGMKVFLQHTNVLLKDFPKWAQVMTKRIRSSCEEMAKALGIETRYLASSSDDKEKLVRQIAENKGIKQGPICLLSVVEPCIAPTVKGNKSLKKLVLEMRQRKCVWLYYYFNDPTYGFGHVRLQTWLPFNVFIWLNGRHWLERQLQSQGIAYVKDGNCFPWIEDIDTAQVMLNKQLQTNWSEMLNRLTFQMCPALKDVLSLPPDYYWSADATEWATDIMFKSRQALDEIYPSLIYHAMKTSDSASVMRFFGNRHIKGRGPKEVVSDYRRRYEGVRVRHWKNDNSVKLYNKSGNLLRLETTLNGTRDFKVLRHPNDDEKRPLSWQKMRKGVSDLHRRCEISQQCNERYADALASSQVEQTLKQVISPACNKITKKGKRYRGLNPWQTEDYRLLTFLVKGEHALSGFRNKDLRHWLYPESRDVAKQQQRKYSGRTTRRIKLLRVHGLVRKVARENRYVLTSKGQQFASALMAASHVDIKGLTKLAS